MRLVALILVTVPAMLVVPACLLLVAPIDETTTWPVTTAWITVRVALAVATWILAVVPFGAYRQIGTAELAELRRGDVWHFTEAPIPTANGSLTLEVARRRWASRTYIRSGIKTRVWPARVVCVFTGELRTKWRWINAGGSRARYLYILDASGLPTRSVQRPDPTCSSSPEPSSNSSSLQSGRHESRLPGAAKPTPAGSIVEVHPSLAPIRQRLDELRIDHLSTTRRMLSADGGSIRFHDLFLVAALQRSYGLVEALIDLADASNLDAAVPLVRLQLDSRSECAFWLPRLMRKTRSSSSLTASSFRKSRIVTEGVSPTDI